MGQKIDRPEPEKLLPVTIDASPADRERFEAIKRQFQMTDAEAFRLIMDALEAREARLSLS